MTKSLKLSDKLVSELIKEDSEKQSEKFKALYRLISQKMSDRRKWISNREKQIERLSILLSQLIDNINSNTLDEKTIIQIQNEINQIDCEKVS